MKTNDFGWINSPEHPIKPKPNKRAIVDFVIGLVPMVLGAGYIAVTSFLHGAHAYERSEFEVLDELGLLSSEQPVDKVSSDIF